MGPTDTRTARVMQQAIWNTADRYLRNVVEEEDYGDYIIPFTVLRRLESLLADTKPAVLDFLASTSLSGQMRDLTIQHKFGLHFYNSSKLDLTVIAKTDDKVLESLKVYVASFSDSIRDIWTDFKILERAQTLADAGRLWGVIKHFSNLDMHPETLTDTAMGDIFEDVMYRAFNTKGKGAGAFYTPRDAIRLMVDVLFHSDDDGLTGTHPTRSIYDPTAGTGGMLLVASRALKELNPNIDVGLYGQEMMATSYAIGKADLLIQGGRPDAIRRGNTLLHDLYADQRFDYILSNPPFGTDWSADRRSVEEQAKMPGTRFSHGLPSVEDGQMLFLAHCASKLRPAGAGSAGGRAAVVSNGSPLFIGGPRSGPDNIRAWLLTSDLVDAIIALPTNMFYGTGIPTYVWILDTNKEPRRKGKIQLIDGSGAWSPMAKSMGEKRREMSESHRNAVLEAYEAFDESSISRIVTADELGYRDVTVYRQRRLAVSVTDVAISQVLAHKDASESHRQLMHSLVGPWSDLPATIRSSARQLGLRVSVGLIDVIMTAVGVDDDTAPPAVDRRGRPVLHAGSKVIERVLLAEDMNEHMEREVVPFAADAIWDEDTARVGYEVPMTRLFYKPTYLRSLDEIDADVLAVMSSLSEKFKAVHGE